MNVQIKDDVDLNAAWIFEIREYITNMDLRIQELEYTVKKLKQLNTEYKEYKVLWECENRD